MMPRKVRVKMVRAASCPSQRTEQSGFGRVRTALRSLSQDSVLPQSQNRDTELIGLRFTHGNHENQTGSGGVPAVRSDPVRPLLSLVREIHRKVLKQSKFPSTSRPISYIMLTTNWIRFPPVASPTQRLFPAWALLSPFRDPASGSGSHPGGARLAPEGGISQPS